MVERTHLPAHPPAHSGREVSLREASIRQSCHGRNRLTRLGFEKMAVLLKEDEGDNQRCALVVVHKCMAADDAGGHGGNIGTNVKGRAAARRKNGGGADSSVTPQVSNWR